jgi:TPP-dependent pyruvate/acetoin dehydrogenase alpha subunit
MQLSRSLAGDGTARSNGCWKVHGALPEKNPCVLNVTLYSYKAQFHLDGYVNKQDVQFWASEDPILIVANPLLPERIKIASELPKF